MTICWNTENQFAKEKEFVLIDEGYDLIGAAVDSYLGTHVAAITFTDKIKEGENQCR